MYLFSCDIVLVWLCGQHLLSPPGDFQFSVSSDDNSEFWLSSDESPLNARLLVYVGQVSTELSCTFSNWTSEGITAIKYRKLIPPSMNGPTGFTNIA